MKRKRNVNESSIFLRNLYKFYIVIWEAHDLLFYNLLGLGLEGYNNLGLNMLVIMEFVTEQKLRKMTSSTNLR